MNRSPQRPATRRVSVALLVWAGLWLVSLVSATPASAHATLVRSDPAPFSSFTSSPEAITLWFTEEIEVEYSRIDILRRDGSRVLTDNVTILPDSLDSAVRLTLPDDLPVGSYTVVWSVLSAVDSHVSEGYFSFAVGDAILPSQTQEAELARSVSSAQTVPQVFDAAARWFNLLGQAIIAGLLIFVPVILMPVLRDDEGRQIPIPSRRYRLLLAGSLAILVTGHLASAIVQIMNATRSTDLAVLGEPLRSLLTGTRYGALWLSRSVLIVALAVLVWLLTRGKRLLSMNGQRRVVWIWAIWIAALVLLTTSLGSHAAARGGAQSLPVAFDWIHLLGMSIWTGGLLGQIASMPLINAAGPDVRSAALRRFSIAALAAFISLAVTGTIAAIREVSSIDGLIATRYGLWFTVKLVIVAGAVGFGAWHWLVVRPALDSGRPTVISRAAAGFRRTLRIETALVVLAIAATGLLTSSIPARDLLNPGAEVFGTTQLKADASVTLRITPGQIGPNEFSVVIGANDPDTFVLPDQVLLQFTSSEAPDSTAEPVVLQQSGPNDPWTYRGTGGYLAYQGDWLVTAIIQRDGLDDITAAFALTATSDGLRPAGVSAPASSDDNASTVLLLGAVWLLGALTLATAALQMHRRERVSLAFSLLAFAVVAALFGSILLVIGSGIA